LKAAANLAALDCKGVAGVEKRNESITERRRKRWDLSQQRRKEDRKGRGKKRRPGGGEGGSKKDTQAHSRGKSGKIKRLLGQNNRGRKKKNQGRGRIQDLGGMFLKHWIKNDQRRIKVCGGGKEFEPEQTKGVLREREKQPV